MGERRLNSWMPRSARRQHLFTAFSDMAGASFALAYGEINGRVVWSQDMDVRSDDRHFPQWLAYGGGRRDRTVWLLDFGRRNVWEFGQANRCVRWPVRTTVSGPPMHGAGCSRSD